MLTILRQVSLARRRLLTNLLLDRLAWGLLIAAGAWALTTLVVRLFALGLPLWTAGGIATLVALLIGAAAAWLARPSALHAAVALDQAAGLKERLSTAILVQRDGDPFARAAIADAEHSAGRVHVPSHIRYNSPRVWPLSVATLISAALLAQFMPQMNLFARESQADLTQLRQQALAEHQAIKTQFDEKLGKIKELVKGDPKFAEALKEIEPLELPDAPGVTPDDVRRTASERIDDARQTLEERLAEKEQAGTKDAKRMFQKLNEPGEQTSNDPLTKSLASGDFEGAKESLKQLADKVEDLAQKADTPEAKEQLARMEQQVKRLADQMAKLSDNERIQKELENKAGMSAEDAKKLLDQIKNMDPKQLQKELQKALADKGMSQQQMQQMMQKIQQQQQAQKQCQNMSQCMSKAAQAMQQCQQPGQAGQGSQDASNALSDAMSQLSQMEMSEQMMNEMEAALNDLNNMRDQVCQGGSCEGQGFGQRNGSQDKIGNQGGKAGLGMGARIGKEKTAYATDPTKAPTRYQGGSVIGRMLIEGPQVRGEASAEAFAAASAEVRQEQDAVEHEQAPRQYQKSLQTYFDRLAGLLHEQEAPPPKP